MILPRAVVLDLSVVLNLLTLFEISISHTSSDVAAVDNVISERTSDVESAVPQTSSNEQQVEPLIAAATFAIIGMTCARCVRMIEKAARQVQGVMTVSVSLAMNTAEIQFDATQIGHAEIRSAISKSGYRATLVPANTGI